MPDEELGAPSEPEAGPKIPLRETARALLAGALIAVFAVQIIIGVIYCLWGSPPYSERILALKDMCTMFLSPTNALVGAAAGFYFGRSSG